MIYNDRTTRTRNSASPARIEHTRPSWETPSWESWAQPESSFRTDEGTRSSLERRTDTRLKLVNFFKSFSDRRSTFSEYRRTISLFPGVRRQSGQLSVNSTNSLGWAVERESISIKLTLPALEEAVNAKIHLGLHTKEGWVQGLLWQWILEEERVVNI